MKRILMYVLLSIAFLGVNAQEHQVKIVAHRGYHVDNGCPENSLAALKATQDLGAWGSEFDIWLTTDGKVVINHNKAYKTDPKQRIIKESSYAELSEDVRLENGEAIPLFEDFLIQAKIRPGTMLVCEMKGHGSDEANQALVDAAWELVQKHDMAGKILFQTFNYKMLRYASKVCKGCMTIYLCSDEKKLKTPSQLVQDGIDGVNYQYFIYDAHPGLMKELQELSLVAGLTAQDDEQILRRMIEAGIDVIGTNVPHIVLQW